MARAHRLAVELSGEGAADRCHQSTPVGSQERSLTHMIPAERVSRFVMTFATVPG